ncbi:MAG: phosphotransferase family protein [Rubrivivax sp.]
MAAASLPSPIDPAGLDALQAEPARWLPVVAGLAARFTDAACVPADTSTVLVGLAGAVVVKVYAPFLHDHFAFERTALVHVHGRLSLPTPRLLAEGTEQGWPWLAMTRLPGEPLLRVWRALAEARRLALLRRIGQVAAELHALPVEPMRAAAPSWPAFLARQREACVRRQQRTGRPAQLLAQLPHFLDGPVPQGPDVVLTGEFTPFNLLVDGDGSLRGMIDFGDGLVGPREYDWLGPMCFFAEGRAERLDAFFAGYGIATPRSQREALLRLLLLHRYSCLPAQMKLPGWDDAPDFITLAARWCP